MSLSPFFNDAFYSLSEFDRLFDEAFNARTSGGNGQVQRRQTSGPRQHAPRMDVHEDKQTNTVTATFELPGLKKEDVNIDVQNNVLTVSGESKHSSDRDEHGYSIRERRYGRFLRSLPLPQGIKNENIKAGLENGILTVTFPKTTPETSPRRINIS